jgi:hypothetical protein
MKVIGGFSAPPNGFWSGEMSSRQEQKTPRNSLSGTDINTDIENPFHGLDVSISNRIALDLRGWSSVKGLREDL